MMKIISGANTCDNLFQPKMLSLSLYDVILAIMYINKSENNESLYQ